MCGIHRIVWGALLVGVSSACVPEAATTRVALELAVDERLGVNALEVVLDDHVVQARPSNVVRVLLPNARAATPVTLVVRGLRGMVRVASGRVTVTPRRGHEVKAFLELTAVACGAWCNAGATECRGDAVVTCEQRDEDRCFEWSEPVACPRDAPYCSLGRCAAACTEECVAGSVRCEGSGVRRCGQGDGDPCLEWLPAVLCADGAACVSGACVARCTDGCRADERRCLGGGVVTCADRDGDGCLEWSPVAACALGQTCSDGACVAVSACHDECDGNACESDGFRACGQFDFDACRDVAEPIACSAGPCEEASCHPETGCVRRAVACAPDASVAMDAGVIAPADGGTSRMDAGRELGSDAGGRPDAGIVPQDAGASCYSSMCTSPDPPTCVSDTVLRTYSATGSCVGGACSYAYVDTTCAYGCEVGACRACVPRCAGRECGDDGCGGSCGSCPDARFACVSGSCCIRNGQRCNAYLEGCDCCPGLFCYNWMCSAGTGC